MEEKKEANKVLESAIYRGRVAHRRIVGRRHQFSFGLYMLWLNIEDLDGAEPSAISHRWPVISRRRFSVISVRAEDYLAAVEGTSLMARLKTVIKQNLSTEWSGQAFMLAQPRHFGFVMNPLALYYCYSMDGVLEYVVGEITNTPWGEHHCYVFPMSDSPAAPHASFHFKKQFHVSPFLPMAMDYTWRVSEPGRFLAVNIWNRVEGRLDFEAHLTLQRRPLTAVNVLYCLVRWPLMTWVVAAGIYLHAGILFGIKRVRFYDHPKTSGGVM